MNNKTARNFLAFIAVAAVSLMIIELTVVGQPLEYKLILPIAIIITGLIKLLADIFKGGKKPAPTAPATPDATDKPPAPKSKTDIDITFQDWTKCDIIVE